jgi:CubicO group peptidase (beta-lactamase class C family)
MSRRRETLRRLPRETDPMSRLRVGLVLLVFLGTFAQARADEVDDFVLAQMKAKHIPGLSIAIVRDGRVVRARGYGLASVELKAPATEETVYEIGSITKQFTATAVMMLVEEGKVSLDDPISKHLADLPDAWKDVTVRQLLNHTSGIPSYTSATDFLKLARNDYTQREILKLVADKKLDFKPGDSWSYSNTGYYLLGMIVEKAAGQPFADVLADRIFKPLQMTSTRPNNPKAIIPNRSAGYGELLGTLFNRDPLTPSAAFSAGFLVSTVGDMAKWDAALGAGRLLRSSSFDQMYTPARLNDGSTRPYGFGWGTSTKLGHKLLEHGGGTAGFSTVIARYVDDKLTVIVLTNLSGGGAEAIAGGLAKLFLPSLSVKAAKPIDDPDPELTRRLKGVVADLLADKLDEHAFTPAFAKFLSSDRAKAMTKSLAKGGDLASFTLLERGEEGKGKRLTYRAVLGETVYAMRVNLADDGKISGLQAEKDE